jgi:lipid-A-disaccharide synthase
MNYYLIAGERSGDTHAAHLLRELKSQDPAADFRYWGGDQRQRAATSCATTASWP